MLRSAFKVKRAPKNEPYRAFIRTLPCVLWVRDPCECGGFLRVSSKRYATEACHLKSRGAGGGDEPGQLWPGCQKHHQESHTLGRKSFERKYAISLTAIAAELWEQFQAEEWPDDAA